MKTNQRNTNVEILRILAMYFIILSHYVGNIHLTDNTIVTGFNNYFLDVFNLGGLGVNIFVVITGYYMINIEYKRRKLINLIIQVTFYSCSIYLLFCLLNIEVFSIKSMIKSLFPIIFNEYWFATAYIVLYIFSPYINKFLYTLKDKEYKSLIVITIILWSIIPTFTRYDMYGTELLQLFRCYIFGAYLKLNPIKYQMKGKLIFNFTILLLLLSTLFLQLVPIYSIGTFYNRSSIFIIIISVGLFLHTINKKLYHNKIINKISSTMFAVYLIHDNVHIRSFLWQKINGKQYLNTNTWIVHIIIVSFIILIVASGIDFTKQLLNVK